MSPFVSLAALAALIAVPAMAQAAPGDALQLALDRGLAVDRHEEAAWHVTDELVADIADPAAAGIRGWVVTDTGDGLEVTSWKPEGDGRAGVYAARCAGEEVVDRRVLEGEAALLSEAEQALIAALRAVDPSGLERCSDQPLNSMELAPSAQGDLALVYYLAPQASLDLVSLGGHHRYEVRDGKVVSDRAFIMSCIDMPTAVAAQAPEALVISDLLDPVLTNMHVFALLAARLQLLAIIDEATGAIEASAGQPRIRLVEREQATS